MDVRHITVWMHRNVFNQLPGCLGYHSFRILDSYIMREYTIVLNSNLYIQYSSE